MVFFLQERVTVELDHLVSNTVRTKEVTDGLRDQNDNLTWVSLATTSYMVMRLP